MVVAEKYMPKARTQAPAANEASLSMWQSLERATTRPNEPPSTAPAAVRRSTHPKGFLMVAS